MEKNQRLLGMLGFAMRAGKLIIGTEMVCKAMKKKGSVLLVAVASDASEGTRKKISSKCEFYGIKTVQINMRTDELGAHLGKTYTPACVGIADRGFAEQIEKAASSVGN